MTDQQKFNQLRGKRVLLTGGTSGIGFAVAEACLESDAAQIFVVSGRQISVDRAVARLKASYPSRAASITGHAFDLSDVLNLKATMLKLLKLVTNDGKSKLDHIVHTAADGLPQGPLDTIQADTIDKPAHLRFYPLLLGGQYFSTYMNISPNSSITLSTGGAADRPHKGHGLLAPWCAFAHGVTRGLAVELAPIRVNCVSPGFVDTELWTARNDDSAGAGKIAGPELDGVRDAVVKMSLTKKLVGPDSIAHSYIYAMKSDNVDGQILSDNSGIMLVGPM